MKFNCGKWADDRQAKALAKKEKEANWHDVFKFYVKLHHNDCRVFETVQRRKIKVKAWDWEGDPVWVWAWEYRACPPT